MEQQQVQRYRITALVVLIAVAMVVVVIALGTRDGDASENPPGSPFSGGGSPVGGSPFTDTGSPVAAAMLVVDPAGASFTAQAQPATDQDLQVLGLQRSGCSGTYWTWRGHFTRTEAGVLWWNIGPINYWCGTAKGNVSKSGWGWVNSLGVYGGVYHFVGGSKQHTPFGYPSVHVVDRWHMVAPHGVDDRYPMVDYDLFADGRVSGTYYKG